MGQFQYSLKNDYDKRVRIQGENILCYSEARIKSVYPDVNKSQLHEARSYSEAEKKPPKKGGMSLYQKQTVGELQIGAKTIGVSAPATNSSLLYKKVGYVCMADGSIVALCVSRVPFFAIVSILAVALIALLVWLLSMLGGEEPPEIKPDHPLPPISEDIVPETGGEGETEKESPEGGGSVSMIYTLSAKVTLSTGEISIHFKNPRASNHSVALQFYIISGGKEYLVAESGLIPSGNGLYTLRLSDDAPTLSEGKYEGMYRVMYYDPVTGVRAHVQSDITDVVVAVKP